MDARLLFPNDYIAAPDLKERDVHLTIDRVQMDELRTQDGSEDKPIVYFVEMEARHRKDKKQPNKRMVLNKTNMKTIAGLFGYETDVWKGQRITLYPTTCQAFGATVDCIRVRPKKPPGQAQAKPETSDQKCGGCGKHFEKRMTACPHCGVEVGSLPPMQRGVTMQGTPSE